MIVKTIHKVELLVNNLNGYWSQGFAAAKIGSSQLLFLLFYKQSLAKAYSFNLALIIHFILKKIQKLAQEDTALLKNSYTR